jgi:hypothetical protein
MAIVKKDPSDDRPSKKRRIVKAEKVTVDVDLPEDMTEPVDELGQATILIHGEKKIGKTTLASQFGDNLVLAFEVGYKGLRLFKTDVPDWDTARALVKKLRKDERFSTITVDTAEKSFKRCEEWSNKKLGITHASEEDWGKGWASIRNNYEKFIDDITHSGKGVILISHSHEQEVKKRNGDVFDRVVSSMSRPARETVEGIVDIWCYYGYEGSRRMLTIVGDDYVSAGHRFSERFRTPDGTPIRRIDMGGDEKEAYKNFLAAWNNEYEPDSEDDLVIEARPKKKRSRFTLRG